MATVPLSGTNIRLLSGVPFNNDYKNTRWFDTISEQENYFLNKPVTHSNTKYNFQRIEGRHFVRVDESIDDLWGTNYMMFQNELQNGWWYAFVTKLEYVHKKATNVHFQIDVFQSWKFHMNFKPSFVVREHCKLWNSDGTPVINTVDEGLDYGTEYDTTAISNWVPHDDVFFLVIVAKKAMHGGSSDKGKYKPMINGSPQPLVYYIHPFKLDGTSPSVTLDGVPNLNIGTISETLQAMYTQTDAVNNIVSLYVTEYVGYNNILNGGSKWIEHVTIQDDNTSINTLYLKYMPYYDTKKHSFGDKWTGFNPVNESKLLMYPYTRVILDDFKGNRVEFKNEHINSGTLEVTVKGSIGTSNKTSYGIQDYNFDANGMKPQLADEFALINNDPNDVPIITDMLSAYLQGNRNMIQNQQNGIMFNGYMNAIGGFVGGAKAGMEGNSFGVVQAGVDVIQGAGNAMLQIQGIQAKQKDIANVPPSLTKMGSNTAYSFGNEYKGVYLIKKQIKPEYRRKLDNFFRMFGYKVNEVKTPNFHTRKNWNYIQTANCVITGNFNNEDLTELKSVFDNGITLWHTDDVGNYNLSNEVI